MLDRAGGRETPQAFARLDFHSYLRSRRYGPSVSLDLGITIMIA
jgi:hypothetical protein